MKVGYSYLIDQFSVNTKNVKVKYIDLPKQAHAEDMLNDIRELLLKTGQYTLGPQVKEFETRFAQVCQTRHAVGLNSGTDALFLSMKVLNIGPGDEVITAPNSFLATTASIANVGARPVFVDVDDEYNIDPNLIEAAITPRTKSIIPVHLTGNPADMRRIMDIAKRHKLHVIEDAAQAVSATIDGKAAGSFGITGCFSMHPLKNLNVWGDGGMATTNSKELYDKLMLLRNHGEKNRDECVIWGYNSRLDTLQAIVALRLMNDLDDITNTRIKHARIYDEGLARLSDYITVPPRKPNVRQVYHTYVVQAKDRNNLYKYLNENGVEAKIHYPVPLHLQEAAQYLGYKEGDFPVCEAQARSILTLPVHQHLTEGQLGYVIETMRKFYKA
ncbi:MAG: DegT/DnrJ/EryC1/StrS family aminotransferase [Chloroflexota bacterium]|nr:DegT/DnrJ/EryC1/StrS family aminotransferase [Chloroflexota bacterium]